MKDDAIRSVGVLVPNQILSSLSNMPNIQCGSRDWQNSRLPTRRPALAHRHNRPRPRNRIRPPPSLRCTILNKPNHANTFGLRWQTPQFSSGKPAAQLSNERFSASDHGRIARSSPSGPADGLTLLLAHPAMCVPLSPRIVSSCGPDCLRVYRLITNCSRRLDPWARGRKAGAPP